MNLRKLFFSLSLKSIFGIALWISPFSSSLAQDEISGIINSYGRVTDINEVTSLITVDAFYGNISDFQVGSVILIYQAKGATINTTAGPDFGTVLNYNSAGLFEYVDVVSFTNSGGNYVFEVTAIENDYDPSGYVQIVSVPQYTEAEVESTLTAKPWDRADGMGGILAFNVLDDLELEADLDVSGLGFHGGGVSPDHGQGKNISAVYASADKLIHGIKGEGIAEDPKIYARAPMANGGGGGNQHNAGGGGGSNLSAGGSGGNGFVGKGNDYPNGGDAGYAMDYSSGKRLFFGGGGGRGSENQNRGTAGGKGGGIVLIKAGSLSSNCGDTHGIYANGENVVLTRNDGAGGGGGGGAILLSIEQFNLSCDINGQANGGDGGSIDFNNEHGAGGGGGAGAFFLTTGSETIPSEANFEVKPGNSGTDCKSCPTPSGTPPEICLNCAGDNTTIPELPGSSPSVAEE